MKTVLYKDTVFSYINNELLYLYFHMNFNSLTSNFYSIKIEIEEDLARNQRGGKRKCIMED